jgi:hypothetical protein
MIDRRFPIAVLASLLVSCGSTDDDVDAVSDSEEISLELASAQEPSLTTLFEFDGSFDAETGELLIEARPYEEWSSVIERADDGDGLRTVAQPLYCGALTSRGVSNTFQLDTVIGSIGVTPGECIPSAELGEWSSTVYNVTQAFCATVRVTSHFDTQVDDVVAEIEVITEGYEGYEFLDLSGYAGGPFEPCCGTGADPTALPDGDGKPVDTRGGMFLHGDLTPGAFGEEQWTFRNPGGNFQFSGRIVGRFPEQANGVDDNCNGRVDEGIGAYTVDEACVDDSDCASNDCLVSGVCGSDCPVGFYATGCAEECPGGASNICYGHGACDQGEGGTGDCACTGNFVGDCDQCGTGFWGASCAGVCSCVNGGLCSDGIGGDGSCACTAPFHGDSCEYSCSNGVDDPGESRLDCGGPCAACDPADLANRYRVGGVRGAATPSSSANYNVDSHVGPMMAPQQLTSGSYRITPVKR